jgi:hypothetical protein
MRKSEKSEKESVISRRSASIRGENSVCRDLDENQRTDAATVLTYGIDSWGAPSRCSRLLISGNYIVINYFHPHFSKLYQ